MQGVAFELSYSDSSSMEEKREITKTEAGVAYQVEVLSKELKRLRKRLADQLALFDTQAMTKDLKTVEAELDRLNQCFVEICGVTSRLTPLLEKEEAEEMDEKVRLDGESVGKVGGAVKEWMKALGEVDRKSILSSTSRSSRRTVKSKKSHKEGGEGREISGTTGLKSCFEVMQAHSRLESQMSLVEDILQLEDEKMIKPELATLDQRYKDLLALSGRLPEGESTEENLKVKEIVEVATERVNEVQARANDVLAELAGGQGSVISSTVSKKSSSTRNLKDKDQEVMTCFGSDNDRDVVSESGHKGRRPFGMSTRSDVGKVDNNAGRFGMYGFYGDHMSAQKEKVICGISKLQKRIAYEVN